MIRHLDHYLDYQREYRGGSCAPVKRFCARHLYILCGNRFGNYLVTLYLSIKVRCVYTMRYDNVCSIRPYSVSPRVDKH